MNGDAIGALAEVIGALAVVATIGYLAVQIKQSTKQARANSLSEISTALQTAFDRFCEDTALYQSGCCEFESLSRADQLRFDLMIAPFACPLGPGYSIEQGRTRICGYC